MEVESMGGQKPLGGLLPHIYLLNEAKRKHIG